MTEYRNGIQVGATEYVIHCRNCGKEYVHHTYSKQQAINAFRNLNWSIHSRYALCPDCWELEE